MQNDFVSGTTEPAKARSYKTAANRRTQKTEKIKTVILVKKRGCCLISEIFTY